MSTKKKPAPTPKRGSHLVLVLPDSHVPNHDPEAVGVVKHAIELLKPRKIILLGDFIDCHAFSRHPPKSLVEARALDFKTTELDPANELLDHFQKYSQELIYIQGNHEAFVERAAAQMGGPLVSVYNMISPEVNFKQGRKNFTWIPYNTPLPHYKIARDLIAYHGISTAKHAASVNMSKLRSVSGIYGHTHHVQAVVGRDPFSDRLIKSWSPGCLSTFQPAYMHNNPSDWARAFDMIFVSDDKQEWSNYTVMIDKGECILPTGRTVKA